MIDLIGASSKAASRPRPAGLLRRLYDVRLPDLKPQFICGHRGSDVRPDFLSGPTRAAVPNDTARRASQNAAGLRGRHLAESLIAKLRGRNPPEHSFRYRLAGCLPVNPTSLQIVNGFLRNSDRETTPMVIYPVPPAVTQARVQLSNDEAAKAAPSTIIQDLGKVIEAQKQAEQALLIDLKA